VADGVTEKEFNQTKNGIETAFVMQLQSIGSRADSFNSYVFYSNGQTNFPEGDLNRYRNATIESMMATVRTLFSDDSRRSTLIVVPKADNAPKDANPQKTEPNTGATP
jgi:predicted Zn-dependent peptidase